MRRKLLRGADIRRTTCYEAITDAATALLRKIRHSYLAIETCYRTGD